MEQIIKQSFIDYAGAVLQSRALVDVRDIIKPSARQIFYCMQTDKFTHKKPFQKTLKSIGSAMRLYIHGDSSCEGVIMRAGQPFAMRYPLVEVEGSYGNLMESGNWAAPRYCITGDSLVNTSNGLVYIQDIVKTEENTDNPIDTIYFKGFDKFTSSNMIFNSGKQPVYKLTLKNGLSIKGTNNHPLLTLDKDFNYNWKTIEDLQIGDKVLVSLMPNKLFGDYNDIDMAKALGCLISEGSLTQENKIDIINQDLKMIEPVLLQLQKYGSNAQIRQRTQKDKCYQLSTTNKEFYTFLQTNNCCYDSYNKHIPTCVLQGSFEVQKTFLQYLFEGDGCISLKDSGYGVIAYSSVSENLIKELQILLATNFGIMSSIHYSKTRNEIKLELGGEDVELFYLRIGFVSNRKKELLESAHQYYINCLNGKSTGSRGWHIYPEIKTFLSKNYPNKGLVVHRNNRADECKGPLMSKKGLDILKKNLTTQDYNKIENIYYNYAYVEITNKEYVGLEVVFSPKINEPTNEYVSNALISHNTAARLSPLSEYLFADIDKNTIEEWRDNYDDTEKYPVVLPSKGYYNICNGSMGIGVGMASSIPQFNIKEVNVALMRLLINPNVPFEDIVCMPDFATGGILLNAAEVKESLKNGKGAACKLRSVITYDSKDNCLVVTEIPYSVYTNTICGQLEEILENEDNPGIDRFNDLTGEKPLIKIYLTKGANVSRVQQYLFKNTSLEYYYSINLTMLENGRYPRVFTWKEALSAHLEHERQVYRKGFEFDLAKIKARMNIIDGLLIAIADIDNVIHIIKGAKDKSTARELLIAVYNFNLEQVNAILDMKLSRLTNLETVDLQSEFGELEQKKKKIEEILATPELLNSEIEKGLREVMNKFGDARRTQILNVSTAESDSNGAENKPTKYWYTIMDGNSIVPLLPEDKMNLGKKGSPYVKNNIWNGWIGYSNEIAYLINDKGIMQKINNAELEPGISNPFTLSNFSRVIPRLEKQYLITVTDFGIVKKTVIKEYEKLVRPTQAVKVREDDNILFAGCADDDDCIYLLGKEGGLIKLKVSSLSATGRATIGVKGINDICIAAAIAKDSELLFTYADGKGKYTLGSDFIVTAKGGKGQTITENTTYISKVTEDGVVVVDGLKLIKYGKNGLATKGKTASGAKISEKQILFTLA